MFQILRQSFIGAERLHELWIAVAGQIEQPVLIKARPCPISTSLNTDLGPKIAIAKDSFKDLHGARIVMAMGTEIAAGKNILDLAAGRNALVSPVQQTPALAFRQRKNGAADRQRIPSSFSAVSLWLSSQQRLITRRSLLKKADIKVFRFSMTRSAFFLKMRAQILEELVIGQLIMLAGAAGIGEITRKTDGGNGHAS